MNALDAVARHSITEVYLRYDASQDRELAQTIQQIDLRVFDQMRANRLCGTAVGRHAV